MVANCLKTDREINCSYFQKTDDQVKQSYGEGGRISMQRLTLTTHHYQISRLYSECATKVEQARVYGW